ncbi:MAG TPA: hypothetical protein VGL09_04960 [Methylomirabilota bacterium]
MHIGHGDLPAQDDLERAAIPGSRRERLEDDRDECLGHRGAPERHRDVHLPALPATPDHGRHDGSDALVNGIGERDLALSDVVLAPLPPIHPREQANQDGEWCCRGQDSR